ncbi:hypothetical protein HGO38_29075 [Rhizobium sp. CG5]|uniref:hypothetical protein n=1 Tax=Rhizobium sp. CG5 TaxID=2726076 RepID=UPI002033E6F1|nr:hypothetical protein [Rhizobium sp. CG5]MCM2477505.1 hypothetical protein [Rhizobium sp. CG5]
MAQAQPDHSEASVQALLKPVVVTVLAAKLAVACILIANVALPGYAAADTEILSVK